MPHTARLSARFQLQKILLPVKWGPRRAELDLQVTDSIWSRAISIQVKSCVPQPDKLDLWGYAINMELYNVILRKSLF